MTKERYSNTARPDILEAAKAFTGKTASELKIIRATAVANRDWLTMQTTTYLLSQFPVMRSKRSK